MTDDIFPMRGLSGFRCPLCGVYAHQEWKAVIVEVDAGTMGLQEPTLSLCMHCERYSIWMGDRLVYPDNAPVDAPNEDLNAEIQGDYKEAAAIVTRSPRAAAALLRLAIQQLCKQLHLPGKNINQDIQSLVRNGLSPSIQKALDSVRVIGNEAVHPGVMELRDDQDTAMVLFRLVNLIAQQMLTNPREAEAVYSSLPEEKREQIRKRDAAAAPTKGTEAEAPHD